ncbi:MAG TPA: helix-turn-helix transcriptional regulator [Phenylobacterium sp.]|jgi:transcriptional regulator with XRE-family HTH domain|nr:helix-turn-helix transcriptional regulator [Phenylobacterium sp.]
MPAWVSSPVHREVIAALVSARKAAGMTQRDVAAKIGKPPSFIGKVEAIERNLSILEFIEWSQALGTPAARILAKLNW